MDQVPPQYSEGPPGPTSFNLEQVDYETMKSVQTLQLLHVNPKLQTMSFPPGSASNSYNVKVNDGTGFLNKPDLLISRDTGTLEKIGEGRFEKYGPGTTIKYPESGKIHDLQLETSLSQRFKITHDGKPLWLWQPSIQDKYLVQVLTASNELIAQFTYSGEHTFVGRDVKDNTVLGVLEVDGTHAHDQAMLDQLVCMTVVLVERSKRRGRKLHGAEGTSPMTSLALNGGYYGGTVG